MGDGFGCVQAAGGHEQPMCNAPPGSQSLCCYSITSSPSIHQPPGQPRTVNVKLDYIHNTRIKLDIRLPR